MTSVQEVGVTPPGAGPALGPTAGARAAGGPGAGPPAAGRFAALLAGHLGTPLAGDAARWETVTLGQMLTGPGGAGPGGVGPGALAPAAGSALAGARAPATLAAAVGAGTAPLAGPAAAGHGQLIAAGDGGQGGAILAAASTYLGVPYRWGGDDPATGLDCSGLVQRALADLGVAVPRVSADQARAGVSVPSLAEAQPGDLVYWRGRGGRPNHIGVYAGNGHMIHAPRTGDVVRLGSVRSAPPDAIRRVR